MKQHVKKVLWGIAAAFSTPEAVKAEKHLAVTVLTRLAITVPGAAALIDIAIRVLS